MSEPPDVLTTSLVMYYRLHVQAYASIKAAQALEEMFTPWLADGLLTSDQTATYLYGQDYAAQSRYMLCPPPDVVDDDDDDDADPDSFEDQ